MYIHIVRVQSDLQKHLSSSQVWRNSSTFCFLFGGSLSQGRGTLGVPPRVARPVRGPLCTYTGRQFPTVKVSRGPLLGPLRRPLGAPSFESPWGAPWEALFQEPLGVLEGGPFPQAPKTRGPPPQGAPRKRSSFHQYQSVSQGPSSLTEGAPVSKRGKGGPKGAPNKAVGVKTRSRRDPLRLESADDHTWGTRP